METLAFQGRRAGGELQESTMSQQCPASALVTQQGLSAPDASHQMTVNQKAHRSYCDKPLLQAYLDVLKEAHAKTLTHHRLDRSTTSVMCGFLAGAVIALRSTEPHWSERFHRAGTEIKKDWHSYVTQIQSLCDEIESSVS